VGFRLLVERFAFREPWGYEEESHAKRNLLIIVLVIGIIFGVLIYLVLPGLRFGSNRYSNKEIGFSSERLDGWDIEEVEVENTPGVIFTHPSHAEILVFSVNTVPLELGDFVDETKDSYSEVFENYEIISEGSRTVAGVQAHEIVLEYQVLTIKWKMTDILLLYPRPTVIGSKIMYSIKFYCPAESYNDLKPTFKKFLDSFQFA